MPTWLHHILISQRHIGWLAVLPVFCFHHGGWANQTVYHCKGVYTDQPCKGGREVDILPTEGADKLSGKRERSAEARDRDNSRLIDQSTRKGFEQADKIMHCHNLIQERKAIDRHEGSADRRFQIRQEQFALKCPKQ